MAKRTQRKVVNPSTKHKMSIAHQGSRNPMYGKHHSQQTKELISKKLIEYWSRFPTHLPM